MRPVLLFGVLLSLLAFSPWLHGGEFPPLVVTPAGYWYVVVDDAGEPRLERVGVLFKFSAAGVDVGPSPPESLPTPPAAVLNSLVVDRTRAAASTVGKWDDAQRLALVYDAMADHFEAGKFKSGGVWKAVVLGTDVVLKASGTESAWKPWREELGRLTGDLTSRSELDETGEIHTYLKSVVAGLQSSVPPEAQKLSLSEGVKVLEIVGRIASEVQKGDE